MDDPVEQTAAATPPPTPSPTPATDGADAAPDRTPEEVEAIWSKRLSQRDLAHNAAEKVLQDQITTLQRQLTASPSADGQPVAADSRVEELQRELETERGNRLVAERKAKFPALAQFLGGADDVFRSGSDVTLAKLNSTYEDSGLVGTALIAPTAPKRTTAAAAKPLGDKSKEELLDDLRRLAPAYDAWNRENNS